MHIEGNHVFGVMKLNLRNGDRVVIGRTLSELDGMTGTVVGISFVNISDIYIVKLDNETYCEWECITIPEVCLSKLE